MKLEAQRTKDKLWIHANGRIYALPLRLRSATSQRSAEAEEELIAPFACKVLKLHVKPGQKVKKGDPIAVVEAMKMEYSYSAPHDGEIAEVLVQPGVIVQQGAHFVRWKGSP